MKQINTLLPKYCLTGRRIIALLVSIACSLCTSGQLTGTKYIPGDYATITLAVAALNTSGTGTGGVTFNVAANYTETISATIPLTATGTSANPIVFQKDTATSGANPLITAYPNGTWTPSSSQQDGIWRLSGSDYITIDGIDVRDNPANTTNPATMEYGYALYKASSTNGCQFVTIKNCTVTLNNINNASPANPMTDGCSGILIMNAAALTAIVVYGPGAGGGNSNNKIYSNLIQNCNIGISMVGAIDASPFTNADNNNDIGGNTLATGNTIINFGGGAGATNPSAAIRTQYQYGLNVSYNVINNNNGSGTNHPALLRGIQIGSAVSANATIEYNTITLNGGGTTSNVYPIDNSSGSTSAGNTVNINNNTISNSTYSTATSGNFYGIYNTAAPAVLNINNNIFTGNATSSTSGVCVAIYNSGAVASALNINNNTIGNGATGAVTFNAANSGVQTFINNTGGASTAALSISNNNFQGISYAVQGSGPNNYILNSAVTLSQAINNNTFTALNVNTTGSVTFITNSVIVSSTGTQNVNSNSIVTSFTKPAAGGSVIFFTSSAASPAGSIINNNDNNFSNITVTGATTLDGWINTDAGGSTKTIQNNTFSNWVAGTSPVNGMNISIGGTNGIVTGNTINNISGGNTVTGLATGAGSERIYSNTINTLSTTGTTVTGISITGGNNKNIYNNKIYDLQLNNTSGTANGILVSNNTLVSVNIYNNLIGDLRAPVASTTNDVIRGISVIAFSTNSTVNVYSNTVHINASSTGTNFSTSGIYHSVSATSTTTALNLRNNIISNTSTPKGSGFTVAYRRSGTALNNYASTSNNNLFYAGSAGTYRLIFFDGTTSDPTLTTYKARVSLRDAQSFTEDLTSKFLTTSGSSASFLHLDEAKATLAEGGAVNIINFTNDYDGQVRQGNPGYIGSGSAPDIGADEINGTTLLALSGNYNTGSGQAFTSLTNAGGLFATINSLGLSGNIVVNVTSDLAEDGSNSLYQWVEQGIGNYTVTIQPNASTPRIISGDVINGLIRLNGAKRVTIDGSNGTAFNYLTFRNPNTSGTTGTALTFINGASGNSIRYCNAEAYANAANGVILFSTSTESGGNSNNVISNCNINATLNSNTGNVCVYSAGTATPGYANSNNFISNNNIYNYRDRGLDITATGSATWTVSGNSVYNGSVSASVDYAATSLLHGIRILGGGGYSVLNNYIGGSAALATGSNASCTSSSGNIAFYGITVTAQTGITNIKGNIIRGISVSSIPAAANAVEFTGIETIGTGIINVGGTSVGDGNTIGSNTNNGSIIVTTTTTTVTFTSFIRGIYYTSTNATGIIYGNQVGGFDISNLGSSAAVAAPSTFQGIIIFTATAPTQINNNIIGSTGTGAASNSIRVVPGSLANTSILYGIYLSGSVISTVQVNANTVQNISQQVTTVTSGPFYGIWIGAVAGSNVTITNNCIKNNSVAPTTAAFYGIWNNANPSSLIISGDTITNNTSTAGTSGLMYGIYTQGSSPTVAINNNTFAGNTVGALTSTPGFVGIYNNAVAVTLSINGNAYYSNVTNTTGTGNTYFIRNTGAVTGSININDNTFGTASLSAITFNGVSTSNQYFIDNTNGTANTSLSISNNLFRGINYAAGGTGGNIYINNTAATISQAINGNTFTNLNVNTSGNITFISNSVILPAAGTQNVNNNSISGTFTKAAGNNVTLFTSTATSASGAVINNNNNNFSNITVTAATSILGWVNTDAGSTTKTIQNNTFSNWTGGTNPITAISVNSSANNNGTSGNLINNITSTGTITGITTGTGNDNIYSNTIYGLSTTGGTSVNGISITAGTTKNIYKNKVYDLQAGTSTSGTVNGILVSGGTTVNIYNNLVGNLRTPAASASDPIRGISVTSAVAPSTINVYYNTIYINATSTGGNFGTTGIYHITNATATTSSLNLRNNSVTNTSTPNGSGYIVAYRLSTAALNNYATTSDNNMFYAGTPALRKLLFWDGTTGDQGLTNYKSRVSTRDASTITEDITAKFLSVTGSSAVFLHMDSTIASAIKNGAVNISGYTDDYDGQIRYGNAGYTGVSSAPSIGADEAFGIENVLPSITYTSLGSTTSTANRVLTSVVITDASGINTNPGTKARIYYKRSADANVLLDNTSSTNGWKFIESSSSASPYSFTIDYSLLYGGATVTAGLIQYFIVAQDLATVPNTGINSGTFSATPAGVALTAAAFPITGTINNYGIAFSGTYNVGITEVFTSLTKADGLFASINSAGLMGNTVFNITSDLSEDGTNALNQWTETGAGNYTLTVQPNAATLRTISGNAVSGLIRLSGTDRLTIDGSNSGSGIYLSFKNTNTVGTGTAFTFINGAANNIIRYCDAEAVANATNGVILFSTSSIAGGNSSNLIDNCTITATVVSTGNVAVCSAGTVGNENSSNTISNSNIYGYKERGLDITATGSSAWAISGNSFYNGNITGAINYPASSELHGIRILGGSGYSLLNNGIGASAVNASGANAVYSSTLGNVSYQGILLTTTGASPSSNIKGNIIAGISVSSIPTSAASVAFMGIETNGSGINIGGSLAGEGNQVGSSVTNGSVIITTSTTSTINTSLIKGINCNSTGGSIAGNLIAGIDINNIGFVPASSAFSGISVNSSTAPSQVINNIIGSRETSNSIRVLSTSGASATSLTGISFGTSVTSNILVNGNMIDNIGQLSLTSSGSFTGINNNAASGTITISNDTIQNINTAANAHSGSTVYNGISTTSASSINNNFISNIALISTGVNAQITGINVSGAFVHSITGNVISDFTTSSSKPGSGMETGAPSASAIAGIINTATAAGQTISGNRIDNLNLTNTTNINTIVTGIGISATVSGNIFNNLIAGFTNQATGSDPGICGVMAANGAFNFYNNSVKLTNAPYINAVKIYGVNHAAGDNWNYYYNTVSIAGNSNGTALRSAAFIRPVSGTLSLKNNIFINTRSGTGSHYAISNIVATPASSWSAASSNYNDLYSINAATVGEWGPVTNKTFTQWQTASGGDAASVSRIVNFIASLYDLQPDSNANCALNSSATPISSPIVINTDINNASRSATVPDMGAYEFNYTSFVASAANNSPACSNLVSFTSNPGVALNATYTWTDPNNNLVAAIQNPDISVVAGTYIVTVTDGTGCFDTASTIVVLSQRATATLSGPSFTCAGSSATLSLTFTGNGTMSGSLSSGEIFSGTTATINVNVSPSSTTAYFISSLTDGNCLSQASDYPDTVRIKVIQNGEWSGASGTNWSDAGNWCNGVPTSTTDVLISGGSSYYPVISSPTTIHNIRITAGASLINNSLLQIGGSIINNGTFTVSDGTIELNGSSTQTIPASAFSSNILKNLIASNNVLLAGQVAVTGVLSFGNVNNKTFTTGGYLTLKSNAVNTAALADITNNSINSGNSISGNVTVERYLSSLGNRAYRLLASSVNTAASIHNNWQEGATSNGNNPYPGYGAHITGTTVDQTNGFDATSTSQGSLFTYDQVASAWVAAPNTNSALLNGQTGYLLYIRGDRSINLGSQSAPLPTTNVTLRATGTLLTGTQIFSGLAGNSKFSLITNPFASSINWTTVQAAAIGVTNAYSFWDANFGTRGGFVTVNTSGIASSGSATQNIQSGQAFFVQAADAAGPIVTVRETDKSPANNIDVFSVTYPLQTFSTSLYFAQDNGTPRIADGVIAVYNNNYSSSVDRDDAEEINNWDENIAIARESKHLSIESRPLITAGDTLPLFMNNMKVKDYKFIFAPYNLNIPGAFAELVDNFTRARTPISTTDSTTVSFSVSGANASKAPDRFYIVFQPVQVLPVTLTNFKAFQQGGNIAVEWKVENELNMKQYEVERSADGINFIKMTTVAATGRSEYKWLDLNPANGSNFYRIKSVDADAHSKLSNIVKVNVSTENQSVTIYPNPIQNGMISVSMMNMPKGNYAFRIVNNLGQIVMKKLISHTETRSTETIFLEKNIPAGLYFLEIIKPDNKTLINKIYIK